MKRRDCFTASLVKKLHYFHVEVGVCFPQAEFAHGDSVDFNLLDLQLILWVTGILFLLRHVHSKSPAARLIKLQSVAEPHDCGKNL